MGGRTLTELGNDRWTGTFRVATRGRYGYTLQAWVDHFATWRRDLAKKVDAGLNVSSELLEGAEFVKQAAKRASGEEARRLYAQAEAPGQGNDLNARVQLARAQSLRPRCRITPTRAEPLRMNAFSASRLSGNGPGLEPGTRCSPFQRVRAGTSRNVSGRRGEAPLRRGDGIRRSLSPPIHPIGLSFRKGPNNTLTPGPDDPGSPGRSAPRRGHKSVLPELGTLDDFDRLVARAKDLGLEIALDIAFQCSPDHPYVKEHPEWFRHQPDGTIKYAENPPKKYQDIYPIDFESKDWKALWEELRDVVLSGSATGSRSFGSTTPAPRRFRSGNG